MALFVASAFVGNAGAQTVGDILISGTTKYKVTGENLISNGSFDDGVSGWKTANGSNATVWTDAVASNFIITETGGYDNGAYITVNGAESSSVKTLRNSVAVEAGKTYIFRCFTSGKTPSYDNLGYNGLWEGTNATTEGTFLYALQWGEATAKTTTTWTENTFVFTPESNSYVCLRFGWNESTNLDGFFIGEVEVLENFNQPVTLGDWIGSASTNSGQHWDGTSTNYFDNWNSNATSYSMEQKVTLPAGSYVLKAAGRGQATNNSNAYIYAGDKKIYFRMKGDTGYGISTDGNENFSSTGTYANNNAGRGWEWRYINFTLAEETTITLGLGYSVQNSWASVCIPELFTDETAKKQVLINEILALDTEAEGLISSAMNAEVKATLQQEKTQASAMTTANTLNEISTAKDELDAAVASAKASIHAYARVNTYINNAANFGIDVSTYQDSYEAGEWDNETAETARQELNVSIFNTASQIFTNEFALTNWTGAIGTASGQHWSGNASTSYYDTNGTNVTRSLQKTVTLPAGNFVFKAAGRSSTNATMSLEVNGTNVTFYAKGDIGYGISTDGNANFSSTGTYANENKGRGWEWEFVKFTLQEETEVTLTATITIGSVWAWGSFSDVSLWMDDETYNATLFNAAKDALTTTIASVSSLNTTANVGDAAFQIPSSAVTTLVNAVKSANEALNAEDATTESYTEANTALEEAIAAYKNVGLNAPSEDETFNIVLKYDGWSYDGKAMTYIENGRTDAGLYNIQYLIEPNVNYAQAFTFTPVEGKANHYTLSMTDVDGNERYISTGVPYGGNTSQIRTTTDATKALAVKVIATTTDGIWNLHNTEASNFIGSQDAGVYTVNSHIDFALKPAAKAEVTLKVTDLGWATLMLPFNAEIPTGLKVWSCTGEENGVLTLEEVESIVANTPYVVSGEVGEYTFADYGLAKQDAYAGTMFTGTYAETLAPVGSYVLQNGANGFGFYKVADGKQPTVGAYRCYINASESAAPMFSLERGEGTTSIEDAELTNETVVIYDLAGRRVEKMEKGIYIVNGKKVIR